MSFEHFEHYVLLGNQLINFHNFSHLSLKLVIDIIFTLIIVRAIFYPIYKEKDYVFTLVVINIVIFFICFLMESINLDIGFAFGLFAIFAILRYRTEQIPIREMTYMFAVIIVAVLNALSGKVISYAELFLADIIILLAILLLEKNFLHDDVTMKIITYEKIDLIKPEKYSNLIVDLKERTGLEIIGAEVETINFLNDTAKLKILYKQPGKEILRFEEG